MTLFNYDGYANDPGIYIIFNSINWRVYIGQAGSFKKRWAEHYKSLQSNKHSNAFLQNDFNKSLKNAFEFYVLEAMPGSTKLERKIREDYWISIHHDKQVNCYNFLKTAGATPRSCYSKTPNETKIILSEKSKTQWANPEKRELILQKQKEAIGPDHNKAALLARWNGPSGEENRKVLGELSKERWKNDSIYAAKTLKAMTDGRTVQSYKNKTEKYIASIKKDPSLLKEIKEFEGVKTSKSKWIDANLISPDGTIKYTKIYNMNDFARTIGALDSCKLLEVIKGTRLSYMGWTR